MNLTNLRSEFRTVLELDSSGLPGLLDTEIDIFLNNSQLKFVNMRLQGHDIDKTKYPETQKRIDDVNKLIDVASVDGIIISSSTKNYHDFRLFELTDYMHFMEGTLVVSNVGRFKLREIPRHLVNRYEYSNKNHPYIENPAYVMLNNDYPIIRVYFDIYEAYNDSWSIDLEVRYFKLPTDLTNIGLSPTETLTDFNVDVYREIIKLAVDEAIAVLVPQKSQISQQQLNKSE